MSNNTLINMKDDTKQKIILKSVLFRHLTIVWICMKKLINLKVGL